MRAVLMLISVSFESVSQPGLIRQERGKEWNGNLGCVFPELAPD